MFLVEMEDEYDCQFKVHSNLDLDEAICWSENNLDRLLFLFHL